MTGPRKEPLLPQIPLIGLIGLVALSAVIMAVFHQAATAQQLWAIMASIGIATALLPVLLYLVTFGLAMIFSEIGAAAAPAQEQERVHAPTAEMPEQK
ncbi:MAG: hypothetical protein AAFX06_12080 [Planctomycetota bacterium]